jgi:hypothetical protein
VDHFQSHRDYLADLEGLQFQVEAVVDGMIPHAHGIACQLHAAVIAHHINHHMTWMTPAERVEQEMLEEQGNALATGHVAEGDLTELNPTPEAVASLADMN